MPDFDYEKMANLLRKRLGLDFFDDYGNAEENKLDTLTETIEECRED